MLKNLLVIFCITLLFCGFALAASDQTLDITGTRGSAKVLAGYFEEWSIYYANYNLADLEANGSAARLSHLLYAFANVTPTGCAIADAWADFENSNLPPVGESQTHGRSSEILLSCRSYTRCIPSSKS